MNCPEFENLISGYLDGEISDSEKKEFELHMESCEKCSVLVREYTLMDHMLRSSEDFLPDESYWPGFDARLNEKTAKKQKMNPFMEIMKSFRRQFGWAAVGLLILAGMLSPVVRDSIIGNKRAEMPVSGKTESIYTETRETLGESLESDTVREEKAGEGIFDGNMTEPEDTGGGRAFSCKDELKNRDPGIGKEVSHNNESVVSSTGDKERKLPSLGGDDYPVTKPEGRRIFGKTASERLRIDAEPKKPLRKPAPEAGIVEKPKEETFSAKKDSSGDEDKAPKPAVVTDGKKAKAFMHEDAVKDMPAEKLTEGKSAVKGEAGQKPQAPLAPGAAAGHMASEPESIDLTREKAPAKTSTRSAVAGPDVSSGAGLNFQVSEPVQGPSNLNRSQYLADSKAILKKIVNTNSDSKSMENLQKEIKLSNLMEEVNNNPQLFENDPELKKHVKKLAGIISEVLKIDYRGLDSLKKKIIESQIIDETP